jgi:AmmeMemoRadiSam system protein B
MNMKHLGIIIVLPILLSALWLSPDPASSEERAVKDIRPSILAGTWYPGAHDTLSRAVQGYLSQAKNSPIEGELKAVVVPHAGYKYSGGVAAYAYRLLQEREFKRIILIGPSHRVAFRGVSVNLQSAYETPLGMVSVDRKTGKKLLATGTDIRWLKKAHAAEHSLEIQLPFLQTVLRDFKIVPIVMGQQDFETCFNLAEALVQVLDNDGETLVLASTDLSHFHNYDQAKALDRHFIKYVRMFDPKGLSKALISRKCEACGAGPVITTLLAASKMGADKAMILKYANSGDVTGDHGRVVGYMSAALMIGQ